MGAGLLPIIFRGSAKVNTSWVEPFTHHMVLWIALFGAIIATRDQKHITVDALGQLLPHRWKHGIRTVTDLLSATICGYVTALSITFIRSDWEFATNKIFWHIPEHTLQLALPIGFSILALRFLLNAIRNGQIAKNPTLPDAAPEPESEPESQEPTAS